MESVECGMCVFVERNGRLGSGGVVRNGGLGNGGLGNGGLVRNGGLGSGGLGSSGLEF